MRERSGDLGGGDGRSVRLAEVVGSLSLAGDLGLGQPWEHALRTCVVSLQVGEALGLAADERRNLFYVALLRVAGCTADAHVAAAMFGDEIAFAERCSTLDGRPFEVMSLMARTIGAGRRPSERLRMLTRFLASGMRSLRDSVRAGCEVAQVVAGRLGLDESVTIALGQVFERWDGAGWPAGIRGGEQSILARIVQVAQDWETFRAIGGVDVARSVVRRRSGDNYDPTVVEELRPLDVEPSELQAGGSAWDTVLAMEPGPHPSLSGPQLDEALGAMADFADLKSPSTLGHSRGVAELARSASIALGQRSDDVDLAFRSALVHDLGRVAVPASIWEKRERLSSADRERIRLHPYHTERALARSPGLARFGAVGSAHHERLDGSGYHRGAGSSQLSIAARVLAVADAYHAMCEPRPHRPAVGPDAAADLLREQVRAGALDAEVVDAVLAQAGHPQRERPDPPFGLSPRETQVLRHLCRGQTNRAIASALFISPKTVDTHVQHIYEKLGVSTRAAAAMFAMRHGLLAAAPED